MQRSEIVTKILLYLEQEHAGAGQRLSEQTNLLEDFFLDSFGIIDTVMFLEETFAIKLERADINGTTFRSVGTLSELVAQRMQRDPS